MVSSRSWLHCIEQVLCCFVGIYSKQLLLAAQFFFFNQGMESAPIGITPDNKYPV